jgi:hypothetical protein
VSQLAALPLAAQPGAAPADSVVRIYLDCRTHCDFQYLRTELTFIDWVRDRQDADVHLLITSQGTGGGGDAYSLFWMGNRRFEGLADTLLYSSGATDTGDEVRRGLARVIRLGLVRYLARTPLARQLTVLVDQTGPARQTTRDPWNNWVFTIGGNGSRFKESQQSFSRLSGRVSASRVTDEWKLRFRVNGSRNTSSFTLPDSSVLETVTSRYSGTGEIIRSLGSHWSWGSQVVASSSTVENFDVEVGTRAGLEFSIFDYRQSTRRLATVRYLVGLSHFDYAERTIFGKDEETLVNQRLTFSLSTQQPWGSAFGSLTGATYLHDLSKNRLTLFAGINVRIVKGLELNLHGSYSRIRDQLSLEAGGLTDEEILLRLRQLQTDFRYDISFGLSYRFGSILNNVVNPRFEDFFFFDF